MGAWRRSKGVSQSDAAQVLRVPQPTMSLVERGSLEIAPVMKGMLMTLMSTEEYDDLERAHGEFMDEVRAQAVAKMQGRQVI